MSSIIDLLTTSANQYGVPVDLAIAVAQQESGLNPNATSGAGAQGVMQLMPTTAKWLGVTDSFDPAQNIDAGVRYLSKLYNQFGDWTLALAAYNAGPGNVSKYGGVPPFQETQNYVTSIMGKLGWGTDTSTSGDSAGETGSGNGVALLVLGGTVLTSWLLSKVLS